MHIDRSEKQIEGLRLRKHLRLVEPNILPLRILYTPKPVPITRSETELESETQAKRNSNTCNVIWFKGQKLSIANRNYKDENNKIRSIPTCAVNFLIVLIFYQRYTNKPTSIN